MDDGHLVSRLSSIWPASEPRDKVAGMMAAKHVRFSSHINAPRHLITSQLPTLQYVLWSYLYAHLFSARQTFVN